MRYIIIMLLALPTAASASDHCFICQSSSYAKPQQKAIVHQPQVINRIVALQPPEVAPIDAEGIIAEARALEMALQAIPGIDRDLQPPQWRQFRFKENMPAYTAPAALQQQQVVQTQRVTQRYVGIADISFRIKANGTIDFQVDGEQQQAQTQQQTGYGY